MGFPVPLDVWARSNPEVASFIGDTLHSAKNRDGFPLKIPDNSKITEIPLRALWGMLSLEIWFQVFFDKLPDSNISGDNVLLRKSDVSVTRMHEENS